MLAIGLFLAAIAYTISPIDIVPDIPIVGWVDDIFALITTSLYGIQKTLGRASETVEKIAKYAKYITIILGVIAVLLILLLGATIIKMLGG